MAKRVAGETYENNKYCCSVGAISKWDDRSISLACKLLDEIGFITMGAVLTGSKLLVCRWAACITLFTDISKCVMMGELVCIRALTLHWKKVTKFVWCMIANMVLCNFSKTLDAFASFYDCTMYKTFYLYYRTQPLNFKAITKDVSSLSEDYFSPFSQTVEGWLENDIPSAGHGTELRMHKFENFT